MTIEAVDTTQGHTAPSQGIVEGLSEYCDLWDEILSEEDMTIATAKHTAEIGIEGLVFHGTLHATCIKGCTPDAVLVRDSGWTLVTADRAWWIQNDETGEIRYA